MNYEEFKKRAKKINRIVKKQKKIKHSLLPTKLPTREQLLQKFEEVHWLLAEQLRERQERSQKIKDGLKDAKKRGVRLGGTRGARRKAKVTIDVLRALTEQGWSQLKIAKHFDISQGWVSQQLAKDKKKRRTR